MMIEETHHRSLLHSTSDLAVGGEGDDDDAYVGGADGGQERRGSEVFQLGDLSGKSLYPDGNYHSYPRILSNLFISFIILRD